MLSDCFGYLGHLLGSERELGVTEEHIALLLQGYEMDMGVGNLHAQHGHADALAGEGFFECHGHLLGEEVQACEFVVLEVEDIVYLTLGDYEGMSFHHGVDVEEGKVVLVLGHLVAGNLACHDSAEYACHNVTRC